MLATSSSSKVVIPPDFKFTLPPRKRARTKEEKEQRRIERVLRNRKAAYASREKKRRYIKFLEKRSKIMENIMGKLENRLETIFKDDKTGLTLVSDYRDCLKLEKEENEKYNREKHNNEKNTLSLYEQHILKGNEDEDKTEHATANSESELENRNNEERFNESKYSIDSSTANTLDQIKKEVDDSFVFPCSFNKEQDIPQQNAFPDMKKPVWPSSTNFQNLYDPNIFPQTNNKINTNMNISPASSISSISSFQVQNGGFQNEFWNPNWLLLQQKTQSRIQNVLPNYYTNNMNNTMLMNTSISSDVPDSPAEFNLTPVSASSSPTEISQSNEDISSMSIQKDIPFEEQPTVSFGENIINLQPNHQRRFSFSELGNINFQQMMSSNGTF
ncbi:hypothetical protein TBLA_0D02470 [Henningerozyma blattae CBS 6284]|uniref:BZIP domain-containing protein n=1 Tax=Henningerozyma blattae (strain ATCC 34711 / CBS 6284 / DSM 70876 / NBRC 10599 / NRRL Y-10934 / UCD 77-7) TaxID=1071380 RepID=I2H2Z9_HENB6|nr:hypothetical protein TBLA_0D02470 [Tetrapisispora blattae CBS 6284]CCH60751.1 hypothetical protein TBLA_0D02470 [Tetrapisispora blattae CBS 6284]